jgi:hypothetical protein
VAGTTSTAEGTSPGRARRGSTPRHGDATTWSTHRPRWVRADGTHAVAELRCWTPEELSLLAAQVGADTFATAEHAFGWMSGPERDGAIDAMVASLLARDHLRVIEGSVVLDDDLIDLVELGTRADLVVRVSTSTRTDATACWYGLRAEPAAGLRIESPSPRTRRTAGFDAGSLVDLVLADLATALDTNVTPPEDRPASDSPITVTILDRAESSAAIRSFVQVETGWWEGSVSVGGSFAWAVTDEGEILCGEPEGVDDPEVPGTGSLVWRLTPSSGEHRRPLLDHLPGA